MEQGQFPQPVSFDDHIIHISRHNKYRLTTDYEESVAQNPVIDQIFSAHVDGHLQNLQQVAMAQMQQQIAAQQALSQAAPHGVGNPNAA